MSLYQSQLLLLEMSPNGVVSTDGFSLGHGCNKDFECESTACNTVEHECVALGAAANGEYCDGHHEHCTSGRCAKEGWWSSWWGDGSSCQDPLALGETCNENADCESEYCMRRSWFRESICSSSG